jgi:hypothetical protein
VEGSKSGLFWFMPSILNICPQAVGWDKFLKAMRPFMKFFEDIVEEHVKSNYTGDSTDFSYAYLEEIKNTTDPNSSFYKDAGRKSDFFSIILMF